MKYCLIALGGAHAVTEMTTPIALSRSMRDTAADVQYAELQDVHTFLWPLSP